MKIVGHRGARGLAPENTIKAIKTGLAEGVDGIEFDIHPTKDGHLVLLHDDSFLRTCGVNKNVKSLTLDQIRKIRTKEGESIPTLQEALDAIDEVTIVVEGKGKGWAKLLAEALAKHPKSSSCIVISFDHDELVEFGKLSPKHKLYGLEDHSPLAAVRSAKKNGFAGIDINYRILNPLIYWWARLNRLEVIVYTLNSPMIAYWLKFACPKTVITTDFPDKMQRFRRR